MPSCKRQSLSSLWPRFSAEYTRSCRVCPADVPRERVPHLLRLDGGPCNAAVGRGAPRAFIDSPISFVALISFSEPLRGHDRLSLGVSFPLDLAFFSIISCQQTTSAQSSYFARTQAKKLDQQSTAPATPVVNHVSTAKTASIVSGIAATQKRDENQCAVCNKTVYVVEKVECNGAKFHKRFVD